MYKLIAKFIILAIFYLATSLSFSQTSQSDSLRWCETEGFYCLKIKRHQSWESLFPDEFERGIVMRINRLNSPLYSGLTITVPERLEGTTLLDFSPFTLTIDPPGEKIVIFDPQKHAFGAYTPDGVLVKWGPAIGGAAYCRDIAKACHTKVGTFRIYSLGSSNCVSTKFPIDRGGAPMPYCMYFNGGQALHGSPGEVGRRNVSHGCVRLFVPDAEWLRYEFVEGPSELNDFKGTKVIVLPYEQER